MWGLDFHRNGQTLWDVYGNFSTEMYTQEAERIIRSHNQSEVFFRRIDIFIRCSIDYNDMCTLFFLNCFLRTRNILESSGGFMLVIKAHSLACMLIL